MVEITFSQGDLYTNPFYDIELNVNSSIINTSLENHLNMMESNRIDLKIYSMVAYNHPLLINYNNTNYTVFPLTLPDLTLDQLYTISYLCINHPRMAGDIKNLQNIKLSQSLNNYSYSLHKHKLSKKHRLLKF